MNWKSCCLTLMMAFGLLIPQAADATLLHKPLSIPELTAQADGIFIGRVVSTLGTRASDRSEIFTVVTLQVDAALKGHAAPDGYLRIQLPGGEVEDQVEVVCGAASFHLGEEAMVFVTRNSPDTYELVGMSQGKFSVRQEENVKSQVAVNDPTGAFLVVRDADSPALASIPAPGVERPLEDLIREIKSLLEPSLASR